MQLIRCKDQDKKSLEEFYNDLLHSKEYFAKEGARGMLDLIERLKTLPDDRIVYTLTSHERFIFLSRDTYESPWFIQTYALDRNNYFVEYLMSEKDSPWPNAYVRGEARSVDSALQMIQIAMDRSEGWK